ncbi:MAG TPA: MFS transporter [Caulobacteraceae bacterium]|nr:MFS transporter [Caulobacteraceae bacterium]
MNLAGSPAPASAQDGDRGATTAQIIAYFAPLSLLVVLVNPVNELVDIAVSFILKDQLHATASAVSRFRFIVALPVYGSLAFGLARDLWNPLGRRDRGHLILFSLLTAAVLAVLAMAKVSYGVLLVGMLGAMAAFRFVDAACQGLLALIGQEQLMSGRLSALWNAVQALPLAVGALASGWVAQHLSARALFLMVAALTLGVTLLGLWKPRAVFERAYAAPQAQGSSLVGDLKRLVRHRAIWAPLAAFLLWNFSPGSSTPLQYYLTNTLHGSDALFGVYNAIYLAAFLPVYLAYGWLCRRFSLRTLLIAGTLITIPQMVPLVLIHSAREALLWAAPVGLMGALAGAAYYDLAIRSCPPGLQGALMMCMDAALYLAYRGGDIVGSAIYDADPRRGFLWCVLLTTAAYAAILPVLRLVPAGLAERRDGEAIA